MRSYIKINTNIIKNNIKSIKQITNKKIIAVIKSNAYGYGIIEIAKLLEHENINYLAVATLEEAIVLRKNNIKANIIVLEQNEDFYLYYKFNLICVIYQIHTLEKLISSKIKIRIHIKFETGLNRLGIQENELDDLIEIIKHNNVKIEGIFTHISDNSTYDKQLQKFEFFAKKLSLLENILIHIDSSRFIEKNNLSNTIRIGLSLYTLKEETLELYSPIYQIKKVDKNTFIGYNSKERTSSKGYIITIPLGYADGWNYSRRTKAFVDGRYIEQIGETCMDHMMFFSKEFINAKELEIIGPHLTLKYLSIIYEESPYQIFTTLSPRIKRIYAK